MVSHQKKIWSIQYPAEIIIDAVYIDYVDDLALLTNIPAQTKSLLHSLKQVARSIGFYLTANETEFKCFKQEGVISTVSGN